ncbi:hypothetical protein EVAR_96113_1 [Eumeta japonica]|uniref:Uncharacterized protein n=1 Tax=Eumeta variegata TaxID=151549 RepID=A0A4C1VDI1_EUMVA|nr:hypothetical protein EVAR_96113_1 [Eumeta japonica]
MLYFCLAKDQDKRHGVSRANNKLRRRRGRALQLYAVAAPEPANPPLTQHFYCITRYGLVVKCNMISLPPVRAHLGSFSLYTSKYASLRRGVQMMDRAEISLVYSVANKRTFKTNFDGCTGRRSLRGGVLFPPTEELRVTIENAGSGVRPNGGLVLLIRSSFVES